jgi:hypothetical protein
LPQDSCTATEPIGTADQSGWLDEAELVCVDHDPADGAQVAGLHPTLLKRLKYIEGRELWTGAG